jgi:hypothetical protein
MSDCYRELRHNTLHVVAYYYVPETTTELRFHKSFDSVSLGVPPQAARA